MPVTDIEDLCKICEPLPDGAAVTAYPMRTDKKKAREELDIVNVVEWRSGSDRQFLLVRRPEEGPSLSLIKCDTGDKIKPRPFGGSRRVSYVPQRPCFHVDRRAAENPS